MTSLLVLAQATQPAAASGQGDSLIFWVVLLAIMALAPFVLTMVTSFAKLVIVGGILRHALGTQQIPPNTVITGLALILTIHIMSPLALKIYDNYKIREARDKADQKPNIESSEMVDRIRDIAEEPIRQFMERHSQPRNVQLFERLRARLLKANQADDVLRRHPEIDENSSWGRLVRDVTILAPAFILTELTQAFQIGFLIFVPFLVIDLVVSNILLAMGMQMLSPTTISMPLKLLLFVLIDGWNIIIRGLVLGYT
jgi:type III secretion protein R